jgi:hypothetical protein
MKARSFCARVFSSLVFTTVFALTAFTQTADLRNDLQSSFTKFDIVRIDLGAELRSSGESKTLTLQSAGKNFELRVAPNDLRSARYRAEDTNMIGVRTLDAPPVNTYKGKIVGESDSEVRLTIDGVRVEGFFENAGGRLFIEPASKYSHSAEEGDSVIYRAEDSLKDNSFICDTDIPQKIDFGHELAAGGRTESVMTLRVLELATEADLEWVNTHGGAAQANSEILSILNMVEGTYNSELNLSISVVYQHTWSTTDPFGASTMNVILTNFVSHWNANFGSVPRDAAHLFSAKEVALSRGLAYLSVICRVPASSYGLSGYVGWAPGKFLVPAHELGHNLGADHVDAAQNCANSLMNPTLTGATPLSFCAFSRDVIATYVSANNSCLSEVTTATTAPFDFDGDGRSDISVFRPSNGVWYLNRSTNGFHAFQFGLNGDKAVAADYDGDGRADAAVYRSGIWYRLRSATNTTDVVGFGLVGDLPVPADFDGDSKDDVAVFRPSTGVWYWLASGTGAFSSVRFGTAGDVPVPGDYDGDGRADINLFRPSTGTWYRLNSSTGAFFVMNFGLSGDKALAGDFDGDAKSDIAVWRPSSGVWYMMRSATGSFFAAAFGLSGDVPAPADFDGDGKTDISVFRPSSGVWYRLNSGNGAFAAMSFGLSSDNPIPSYYIQSQ